MSKFRCVFTPLYWQMLCPRRACLLCVSVCCALSLSNGFSVCVCVCVLTPLSGSSPAVKKSVNFPQCVKSSARAAAPLKTMSCNVLKMSRKVLLPKVPLTSDRCIQNAKRHAWLFSYNKSFLVITVICGSRPLHTNYIRLGAFQWVCVSERKRTGGKKKAKLKANNCHIKRLKRNLTRQWYFSVNSSASISEAGSWPLTPGERGIRWLAVICPATGSILREASPRVHCDRVYFWRNFDEMCYAI